MNLLIVTHVPHKRANGQVSAFEPYVKEINYFPDIFSELTVVAPEVQGLEEENLAPYSKRVKLIPVPKLGGNSWLDKVRVILAIPLIFF